VQESPKSELQLQRYGKKKLQGPFYNFCKWLGLYLKLFSKMRGSSWEFMDRSLISHKGWGLTAKLVGISGFRFIFQWKIAMDSVHDS
jgi:hypothetical protein